MYVDLGVAVLVVVALLVVGLVLGRLFAPVKSAETSVVGHLKALVDAGIIKAEHVERYVEGLIAQVEADAKSALTHADARMIEVKANADATAKDGVSGSLGFKGTIGVMDQTA